MISDPLLGHNVLADVFATRAGDFTDDSSPSHNVLHLPIRITLPTSSIPHNIPLVNALNMLCWSPSPDKAES